MTIWKIWQSIQRHESINTRHSYVPLLFLESWRALTRYDTHSHITTLSTYTVIAIVI